MREQIVLEVRTWLETPFRHQGRRKGVGADCAGVVVGVAQALGLYVADVRGYSRVPNSSRFMAAVNESFDRIQRSDIKPADLMVFSFDEDPQHIAIVSQTEPEVRLIHSWSQIGKCVETRLDEVWEARLRSCHRFKGVTD